MVPPRSRQGAAGGIAAAGEELVHCLHQGQGLRPNGEAASTAVSATKQGASGAEGQEAEDGEAQQRELVRVGQGTEWNLNKPLQEDQQQRP